MFKNKKADTTSLEALIRVITTVAIIILIVLPLWNKVYAAYFNQDKKYLQSFQSFVDNINEMPRGRETFEMKLKEKSSIIGFSKNSDRYECFSCYVGIQNRPTIIFDKPVNNECSDNACICLCDGLQLMEQGPEGKVTKLAQCQKLTCKKIEQNDIVNKLVIKVYRNGEQYWKNGFLFVNGVAKANGLKFDNREINTLVVEKKSDTIGVCNSDMIKFNKNELNFDGCIQQINQKK